MCGATSHRQAHTYPGRIIHRANQFSAVRASGNLVDSLRVVVDLVEVCRQRDGLCSGSPRKSHDQVVFGHRNELDSRTVGQHTPDEGVKTALERTERGNSRHLQDQFP